MNTNASLALTIGKLLKKNQLTLALAESCTGGLVAHLITNIPGSSQYFQGGVIAYSDRIKKSVLKVSPTTVNKYGAVSSETAEEMATRVRKLLNTDIGIAVTGVAGPTGGTREKPVGLVWIGLATEKKAFSKQFLWKGDRAYNKNKSAEAALLLLKEYLETLS